MADWFNAGDVIGLVAIVVSVILFTQQHGLQKRLAMIEEARRAEEITARGRAEVVGKFERHANSQGRQAFRFVVQNLGPAPAREVSFFMLPPAPFRPPPRIRMEEHKLPIPRLDPRQDYYFTAEVTQETTHAVEVKFLWRDETGPREKTLPLSVRA